MLATLFRRAIVALFLHSVYSHTLDQKSKCTTVPLSAWIDRIFCKDTVQFQGLYFCVLCPEGSTPRPGGTEPPKVVWKEKCVPDKASSTPGSETSSKKTSVLSMIWEYMNMVTAAKSTAGTQTEHNSRLLYLDPNDFTVRELDGLSDALDGPAPLPSPIGTWMHVSAPKNDKGINTAVIKPDAWGGSSVWVDLDVQRQTIKGLTAGFTDTCNLTRYELGSDKQGDLINQITGRVWPTTDWTQIEKYKWPETNLLHSDSNKEMGISFGGGGKFAMAVHTGAMSALHQDYKDATEEEKKKGYHWWKAGYAVGASGGSWFLGMLVFTQNGKPMQHLLRTPGCVSTPQLNQEAALSCWDDRTLDGTILSCTHTQQFSAYILQSIMNRLSSSTYAISDGWERSHDAFFECVGIDQNKLMAWNDEEKAQAVRRTQLDPVPLRAEDFILPRQSDTPYEHFGAFPLISTLAVGPIYKQWWTYADDEDASMSAKPPGLLNQHKLNVSVLYVTPVYTGTPYTQPLDVEYTDGTRGKLPQGPLIETYAFGGPAPQGEAPTGQQESVSPGTGVDTALPQPQRPMTFGRGMAASSSWGGAFYGLLFDSLESGDSTSSAKQGCERSWFDSIVPSSFLDKYCLPDHERVELKVTHHLNDHVNTGPLAELWTNTKSDERPQVEVALEDSGFVYLLVDVIGLLVRGVTRVLALMYSSSERIADRDDWYQTIGETENPDTLFTRYRHTGLPENIQQPAKLRIMFGVAQVPQDDNPDSDLPPFDSSLVHQFQVFRGQDFFRVMDALYANALARNGTVCRVTVQTVDNKLYGVRGGQDVDLTLVYTDREDRFIEELPLQIQARLRDPEDSLSAFPWFSPGLGTPDPLAIKLLAEFSKWLVNENMHLLAP